MIRLEGLDLPPAVVAPALAQAKAGLIDVDRERSANWQVSRLLSHAATNIRHANGRINAGTDRFGNIVAVTISPYAPHFWDNVEEGIWPLVMAAVQARLRPLSSCAGHDGGSRRFLILAFTSESERDEFADHFLRRMRLVPSTAVRRMDRVSNLRLEAKCDGRDIEVSKGNADRSREMEADSLNAVFHESAHRYWFAELVVGREIDRCRHSLASYVAARVCRAFLWGWQMRMAVRAVESWSRR